MTRQGIGHVTLARTREAIALLEEALSIARVTANRAEGTTLAEVVFLETLMRGALDSVEAIRDATDREEA